MPNWCSNELTVSGEQKQIAKFRKLAEQKNKDGEKQALSLGNFYPEPDYTKVAVYSTFKGLSGDKRDKPVKPDRAWYDWRLQHWGTKWELSNVELIDEDTEYLVYGFDTAWSPPVEWFEKVAKDYPELTFRLKYEEEGVGFMGVAKAMAGVTETQEISL